jgi:hypothetical protein
VRCVRNTGVDFTATELSSDGKQASSMRKHTLDKRFNSEENVSSRTGRGAKRSKRANRGTPGEEGVGL